MSEITLKPSEVEITIRAAKIARRPLFIWGPPGIAKSMIAQKVATSEGVAFIDMRLSQMDPTDLRGLPHHAVVGGVQTMLWVPPGVLPSDLDFSFAVVLEAEETDVKFNNPLGSNGIHYCASPVVTAYSLTKGLTARIISQTLDRVTVALYDANDEISEGKIRVKVKGEVEGYLALEEFNSAAPSVQAAAYQFIQDRRIGEYLVPDKITMLAMGNRDTDRGITYKMATPVANRFQHVEMRCDYDEWNTWAIAFGCVHPHIIGYLSNAKAHLFKFDPNTATRGFATPRSWHILSDMLYALDALESREYVQRAMICGAIGDEIGTLFDSFRKNLDALPNIDAIIDGTLTKYISDEIGLQYTIVTLLLYRMKDEFNIMKAEGGAGFRKAPTYKNYVKKMDTTLLFIEKNFSTEITVMTYRVAMQNYKLDIDPSIMPSVMKFTHSHKRYFVQF